MHRFNAEPGAAHRAQLTSSAQIMENAPPFKSVAIISHVEKPAHRAGFFIGVAYTARNEGFL
jgi:hypothetical protein